MVVYLHGVLVDCLLDLLLVGRDLALLVFLLARGFGSFEGSE
jgi:hypothetical protein